MPLAPGLHYLLTTVPKLLLPPLFLHAALILISRHVYPFFSPSAPLIASVWLFTLPVCAYISASCTRFVHSREARRMGAELVPQIRGNLPGNLDLLWSLFFRKNMYLLDPFAEAVDNIGTTFGINIMGDLRIFTTHPHNIQQILATNFDNFEKGPLFNKFTGSVLGTGVFNSDGEMWQFHRRITRPYFAKERVTDFRIFDTKSRIALDRMEECFERGYPIDFQDICSRFTIDSACEFLLGASINSLEDPLPQPGLDDSYLVSASNRFARAFADAQVSVAIRGRMGTLWPLLEIRKDRTSDDMKVVRDFIEPIVRTAMEKREERRGADGEKQRHQQHEESLLQHLLNVTNDMKIVVDETINIMLAGRDTTAGLLTFVAYCLAMHPDVMARLREEIISTVGTDRAPTFDEVRGMRYLRAVLNETLRLFPSVPANSRYTINSTVLINDEGKKLYVPAGTRVIYSVMLMQRNESYWGPDAQHFDPDRWLDDRVRKYLTPNPFIFLPFNAGPRICLGQQFAYHETSFFIVRLLQRFRSISLAPEAQPPHSRPPASWREDGGGGCKLKGTPRKKFEQFVMKSHLTMYSEGGLWLKMEKSQATEGV